MGRSPPPISWNASGPPFPNAKQRRITIQPRDPRANRHIRSSVVRVIDETGKQLGILSLSDALREAENRGYDLVEVAPGVHPPVCKIMDFGRYRYQLKQKEKEQLRHQRHLQLKEMKFGLKIGAHDLDIKVGHVRRFLTAGHKTKITVYFRGREIIRPEFGFDMVNRVIKKVNDISIVDAPPKLEGKQINLVLAPHATSRREPVKTAERAPTPAPAA